MGSRAYLNGERLEAPSSGSNSILEAVTLTVAAISQAVRAKNEYTVLVGQGAEPAAAAAEALRRSSH